MACPDNAVFFFLASLTVLMKTIVFFRMPCNQNGEFPEVASLCAYLGFAESVFVLCHQVSLSLFLSAFLSLSLLLSPLSLLSLTLSLPIVNKPVCRYAYVCFAYYWKHCLCVCGRKL